MARKKLYRCPLESCDTVVYGAAMLRYHINVHRRMSEVVPAVARRSDLVVDVVQLELFA